MSGTASIASRWCGESVQVPSKRVPHFKPGKALREAVDLKPEALTQDSALTAAQA